jgi:hypothetical protein
VRERKPKELGHTHQHRGKAIQTPLDLILSVRKGRPIPMVALPDRVSGDIIASVAVLHAAPLQSGFTSFYFGQHRFADHSPFGCRLAKAESTASRAAAANGDGQIVS